jgi:alpha-beta hydrolase superfamily lysophospholipase
MRSLFFIACVLLISGCVRPATPHPPDPSENPRWAFSTDTNPKGVFLVVHGLNLKPSALDPLCGFLASQGFHSYRITLRGHNEPQGESFDAAEWQRDVAEATATIRSRFPDLPFYALGYSIGGLLLTNAFDSNSSITTPRGMILLAPAISLRTFADVATTLSIPPPLSWSVPNLAPPAYRRYELTPIFWYTNTLALYDTMESIQTASRLKRIQTLVVLNPNDELVSEGGTRRWIEEHLLTPEWRVELIHPAPSEGLLKEHLIIDQTSLGESEWTHLRSLVGAFLAEIDR